ncbi:MAG: Smr/MutS family protein [Acidobacteriota bacterium]
MWWFKRKGKNAEQEAREDSREAPRVESSAPPSPTDDEDSGEWWTEGYEVPITDVFDLHSFPPRDVPNLVREYLDAAYEKGLRKVRIIHGRGVGVQRRTVRTLLERDPRVRSFGDAPAEAGGWGATWAELE